MTDDTFDYDDIAHLRKIFSIVYTQLILQSHQINVPDAAFEYLGDLEEKLLAVIRERACH